MIQERFESLKELTPSQMRKAETITKLTLELSKAGVHPIVVDGGGGCGVQFIRCSEDDLSTIGEILLSHQFELIEELNEFIYSPKDYYKYAIDYIVP